MLKVTRLCLSSSLKIEGTPGFCSNTQKYPFPDSQKPPRRYQADPSSQTSHQNSLQSSQSLLNPIAPCCTPCNPCPPICTPFINSPPPQVCCRVTPCPCPQPCSCPCPQPCPCPSPCPARSPPPCPPPGCTPPSICSIPPCPPICCRPCCPQPEPCAKPRCPPCPCPCPAPSPCPCPCPPPSLCTCPCFDPYYGEYGSCRCPCYPGCLCGPACPCGCGACGPCTSQYPPCFAPPFLPPSFPPICPPPVDRFVPDPKSGDSTPCPPPVESFTECKPPCPTPCPPCPCPGPPPCPPASNPPCIVMKSPKPPCIPPPPKPQPCVCFFEYPCSPCCPTCTQCNAPCMTPCGVPPKCAQCGHPCNYPSPNPVDPCSSCKPLPKKEVKGTAQGKIPPCPPIRCKKCKDMVSYCIPRRTLCELKIIDNRVDPLKIDDRVDPIIDFEDPVVIIDIDDPILEIRPDLVEPPLDSKATFIADCHRFLYNTCKSEPMEYEAESVIIFKQAGKETAPEPKIPRIECVHGKPKTLREFTADVCKSPIEDNITENMLTCKQIGNLSRNPLDCPREPNFPASRLCHKRDPCVNWPKKSSSLNPQRNFCSGNTETEKESCPECISYKKMFCQPHLMLNSIKVYPQNRCRIPLHTCTPRCH